MSKLYDFGGYATRNNLECSDGRTIMRDAFKDCDGLIVPLVWNHDHRESSNVLGHALLENRSDGVYAYCSFNDTDTGVNAKKMVDHGDVRALSIYANHLKERNGCVMHGLIREVSLVLAGANPGAYIDTISVAHSDEEPEEAIMFFDQEIETLEHSDEEEIDEDVVASLLNDEEGEEDMGEMTVADVFETLTDEQKEAVYAIVGAIEEDEIDEEIDDEENEEGEEDMHHCLFDGSGEMNNDNVLSHSDIEAIFADAKRCGSLKEAVLAHTDNYGITNIGYLFPDNKMVKGEPDWLTRDMEWVASVMKGVHRTPFSRIKSMYADITEDAARAKGYIKGNLKKEEYFALFKRTTDPQTVYKKQKLDRDDIVDAKDFDTVVWLKGEMRTMLNEELARAILIGDQRLANDEDKISPDHIRPIWGDSTVYTVNRVITYPESATADQKSKMFIRECVKSRKEYKGSGNPVLYTTEDVLTDALLMEDSMGRVIYDTEEKLRTALRVKEIRTVPVMENLTRTITVNGTEETHQLLGIIVNLIDYNVGADKGGEVNLFDDFDIDYNQQKYLIETRCSGALVKPYSAIAIECLVPSGE